MKRKFTVFLLSAIFAVSSAMAQDYIDAAQGVIERTVGHMPKNIELLAVASPTEGHHYYEISAKDGILRIAGDCGVAICKGFYDYIVEKGYGVVTWSGSRMALPEQFEDMPLRKVEAPFGLHIYMNVCALGYTAPYWDWERWQQEIDYMALHGFDMPLAPTAGEAIFARIWKDMGLSDKEIAEYFTGPAHMPWLRMGNMSELDGGMSNEWHEQQVALQHLINDRMKSLGMTPVYQGFAGFVPKAIKDHYPEADLKETWWAGGLKNYMLAPTQPLFAEIQSRYIAEFEREFGKGKYYLIDSFNEMDIPFGEKGSKERAEALAQYGERIYSSLNNANSDAVWVVQGWIFGYQRDLWDAESARSLFSHVPNDRVIIIDLAVDFNEFIWKSEKNWNYLDGFFGKQWIYSTVPNFGGRSALSGGLKFYAKGHNEAIQSPNRGNLIGYGTSPEGIENNEIVYEIISNAGWHKGEIDLQKSLADYSLARYGKRSKHIDRFWQEMLKSSYAATTNNARFRWQLEPYTQRGSTLMLNSHYFRAIEEFMRADDLSDSELYCTDAHLYGALYLSGIAEHLLQKIHLDKVRGNDTTADEKVFIELLHDIDRIITGHPNYSMERWLASASHSATSDAEREEFIREARRLVSVWGGPSLSNYSCRVWSGLLRDYYVPRWQNYFENMHREKSYNARKFDDRFIEKFELSPSSEPLTLEECRAKVALYSKYRCEKYIKKVVATITPYNFRNKSVSSIYLTVDEQLFNRMHGLRIRNIRGEGKAVVKSIVCRANKKDWARVEPNTELSAGKDVKINIERKPITEQLSREVSITIRLEGHQSENIYATVEIY